MTADNLATTVGAEAAGELTSALAKIKHCLGQLNDDQVWWRRGDKTVRLAGRSFEIVGNEGRRVKLRGTENATAGPTYHPRALPYAYDVGIVVARRLGVPDDRIVAFIADDKLFVMTWIGMLYNTFLAEAARLDGVKCKPFPFGVCFAADQLASVRAIIERCISRLEHGGPSCQVAVERLADVGPYFGELSEPNQKLARQDWCDQDFLKRWFGRITEVELVPLDSTLGQDLLAVVKP